MRHTTSGSRASGCPPTPPRGARLAGADPGDAGPDLCNGSGGIETGIEAALPLSRSYELLS